MCLWSAGRTTAHYITGQRLLPQPGRDSYRREMTLAELTGTNFVMMKKNLVVPCEVVTAVGIKYTLQNSSSVCFLTMDIYVLLLTIFRYFMD